MKRTQWKQCSIGMGVLLTAFLYAGAVDDAVADVAEDCLDTAVTQRQMNRCADQNLETERARLDEILQRTRAGLSPESLRGFSASQQAWENWLELNCAWERSRASGGSIARFLYLQCMADHAQSRSLRLEQLLCSNQQQAKGCDPAEPVGIGIQSYSSD